MERMTSEEAYRASRKLEVYDADEVDRYLAHARTITAEWFDEIKRLREWLDVAEATYTGGRAIKLAAAEKVVEAAKATRALETESGGFFAWSFHLDHALAEYDKLKEVE